MAPKSSEAAARELGHDEYRVFVTLRARSAGTDTVWMPIDFSALARDVGLTRGEATRAVRRLVARGVLLRSDRIGHPRAYALNRTAKKIRAGKNFFIDILLLGYLSGQSDFFHGVPVLSDLEY